jgi:DNA-binding MarR family transcriptional regulator
MAEKLDSIEWSRRRWLESDGPGPDHFAAMAGLMRLEQMVGSAVDRILREHDLSRTAYLVMVTLRLDRQRTLSMGQLSKRLILHPTTVSLMTEKLQNRGLVERRPHPTDRRTVLAALTDEGTEVLASTSRSLADAQYGLGGVSDRMATALTEMIRHVRNDMGDV